MRFFVLHGHFYQPPRDDPWWGDVVREESSNPFHDWNERIYYECYLPNATARILDKEGKIIDIVNNYSYINFNFGPTLLIWLKQHHPEFIHFLKEADKESIKRNNGHGNAIAQAYNHIIMPLANEKDKETQVIWGIKFFEHVFERKPEAMWLPETGVNAETLKVLVKHGLKYVILSPYQAEKIKEINGGNWIDVSNGNIDVQMPYRIFLDDKKIDIFFYHGPLSHAISFEHLMHSSQATADRIIGSYENGENLLISIATDGETFGHHHPFSDMGLAHLVKYELPRRNIVVTNFANFLEKFPPKYEVVLKRGKNNLGTSWSCAHGVSRWMEDCGCRIGVNPNWNQKWRYPLREALNWLHNEVDLIFEKKGKEIFSNPWQARNGFIEILINPSEENITKFFNEYAYPDKNDKIKEGIKLLEMQHMAMLMFTSCGWFFDEISGIETVQNLKYSARCIQLAKQISGDDLEEPFLSKLALAKSNIAKFGNGKAVYEMLVKPLESNWKDVLSTYLIYENFFENNKKFYRFEIELDKTQSLKKGNKELKVGIIKAKDIILKEKIEKIYLLDIESFENIECYLGKFSEETFQELAKKLDGEIWLSDKSKLSQIVNSYFQESHYEIKDIHSEEREKIIKHIFERRLASIFNSLNFIWETNIPILKDYIDLGLHLPFEMNMLGHAIFNYKVKDALLKFKEMLDFRWLEACYAYIKEAEKMKIQLDFSEGREICREIAETYISQILESYSKEKVEFFITFQRYLLHLGIDYYNYLVQNIIYSLLTKIPEIQDEFIELAKIFEFNVEEILNKRVLDEQTS